MTPCTQLGAADCLRACIACVMDLHPVQVPDTSTSPTVRLWRDQAAVLAPWLRQQRLSIVDLLFDGSLEDAVATFGQMNPGVPCIVSGVSETGGQHAVVYRDGELVCDPSPEPNPIRAAPEGAWLHLLTRV